MRWLHFSIINVAISWNYPIKKNLPMHDKIFQINYQHFDFFFSVNRLKNVFRNWLVEKEI